MGSKEMMIDSESASNQKKLKIWHFVEKNTYILTFQKQFIQKMPIYQVVHEPDFGTTQPLRDPNALGSSPCTSSRCSVRPGGHWYPYCHHGVVMASYSIIKIKFQRIMMVRMMLNITMRANICSIAMTNIKQSRLMK